MTTPHAPVNRALLVCAAMLCVVATLLMLLLPGESLMVDVVYGAF